MRSTPSRATCGSDTASSGTVEAIAQDDDVLLNRVVLALLDFLRRQFQFQGRRAVHRRRRSNSNCGCPPGWPPCPWRNYRRRETARARGSAGNRRRRPDRPRAHCAARRGNPAHGDPAAASRRPARRLGTPGRRRRARSRPSLTRAQAQIAHPLGDARGLRQGDGELIGARFADHIARLQLVLRAAESQRQTALLQERAGGRHALVLEDLLDRGAVGVRHRGAVARQLQRAFLEPNKLGTARKIPNSMTIATNAIFQRGYAIMRS